MEKLDLKKTEKEYYKPGRKPEIIEIPEFKFLMVQGTDARPESEDFQNAITTLYSVSFTAKFMSKNEPGRDYTVMPLEGLWWADDMNVFEKGEKEKWSWTLMIRQPDFITQEIIKRAVTRAKEKKNIAAEKLKLTKYKEGLSAQIMHIGPFSEEKPNILLLHELINKEGGKFNGQKQKHHEIYLSDFRRTAPEKLRTIIRQPFLK